MRIHNRKSGDISSVRVVKGTPIAEVMSKRGGGVVCDEEGARPRRASRGRSSTRVASRFGRPDGGRSPATLSPSTRAEGGALRYAKDNSLDKSKMTYQRTTVNGGIDDQDCACSCYDGLMGA